MRRVAGSIHGVRARLDFSRRIARAAGTRRACVFACVVAFSAPPAPCIASGAALCVASAGALIYSAPPVEDRFSLPNTRYMLHQPSGGVGGQASDISIEADQIVKMRERLNQIFADQTGQPIDRIAKDTNRNFWMTPTEAKDYGLVGSIINSHDEL